MPDKDFIIKLARVLIAAAWADGELEQEEINSLKDLLFRLPLMSGDEWQELQHYLVRPIQPEEASRLVEDLQRSATTPEARQLALQAIRELANADGVFEDEERRMLAEIEASLKRGSGIVGGLSRFLSTLVGRRQKTRSGVDAESYLENVIYADLVASLGSEQLQVPEATARKLAVAAGIMAKIAEADLRVTEDEIAAITLALQEHWHLPAPQARLVAEISCTRVKAGLDMGRLTRVFVDVTDQQERREFIKTLFAIANSAEQTVSAEIDMIRQVANYLRVPHQEYINAKLTIPREDRGGL